MSPITPELRFHTTGIKAIKTMVVLTWSAVLAVGELDKAMMPC